MTTAPSPGQPAAAYPAAPGSGRAGLLAVLLLVVAVGAVLGAVLSGSTAQRLLFALAGLTVPVTLQAAHYLRQRRLTGDLQRSRSSFLSLVKSTVDQDMGHRYLQGYVFARPLEAEQLVAGEWEFTGPVPALAAPADSAALPS